MSAPHTESSPPSDEAIRLGYEPEQVGLRTLIIGIPIFILTGIVVFVAAWYIEKAMLVMDRDKAPVQSSVQPAPITSAVPLPPLQPSGNHQRVDRQDLELMHAGEDRVFANLGWHREPAPVEDAEKTQAIMPFRVPDSVIAAVAKRTPATSPVTGITTATPEPAAAPNTGGAQ